MGWLREQWADAKYTLSQRKQWEIIVAIVCILLAALSVVLCFIFTIVAPPGQLGDDDTVNGARVAIHNQQPVAMLYKRSVGQQVKAVDNFIPEIPSKSWMEKASICAEYGSGLLTSDIAPSEAVEATLSCLGIEDDSEKERISEILEVLPAALSTGNSHAIVNLLMKIENFGSDLE